MTKQIPVSICITHPKSVVPTYSSTGAASFDLMAVEVNLNTVLDHGHAHVAYFISTGLKVAIPEGYCMKIYPHSELGENHHARLANCVGIIDAGNHDEIQFKLVVDSGAKHVDIKAGMYVAHGVIEEVIKAEFKHLTDSEFIALKTERDGQADTIKSMGENAAKQTGNIKLAKLKDPK